MSTDLYGRSTQASRSYQLGHLAFLLALVMLNASVLNITRQGIEDNPGSYTSNFGRRWEVDLLVLWSDREV